MSGYQPQQYYGYYPAQYDPMCVLSTLIGVAMMIAMFAWAFSMVRKAIVGEPVEPPVAAPPYYPPT